MGMMNAVGSIAQSIPTARSLADLSLKHLIFIELIFLAILKKQFKISILLIESDRLLASPDSDSPAILSQWRHLKSDGQTFLNHGAVGQRMPAGAQSEEFASTGQCQG